MKTVFLLFSTDTWHTHASNQLIAVFDDIINLIEYANDYFELTEEEENQLLEFRQTQGRENNVLVLEEPLNPVFEAV